MITIGIDPHKASLTAVAVDPSGRIMETASYPTATLELSEPIVLDSLPADGETVTADGKLIPARRHRAGTVQVSVQRSGDGVQVSGSIPVNFADYDIANPSFGPVTTEDRGEIEFLLVLTRA